MTGGITYDGRYVSSASNDTNSANNIEIDENDPNALKLILDKNPKVLQEKIEKLKTDYQSDVEKNKSLADELYDGFRYYDHMITGSYTVDLAFGAMYPLCISGIFGKKVQNNTIEITKVILNAFYSALKNVPRAAAVAKVLVSLMLDNSEGAKEIRQCVYGTVNTDYLLEEVGIKGGSALLNASKRVATGMVVNVLIGRYVPASAKGYISKYAFWAVLWGAAMRLTVDLQEKWGNTDWVTIFSIFEAWLTGSSDATLGNFDVDTNTYVTEKIDLCLANMDPKEIELLRFVLQSLVKFGENPT